MRRPSSEATIDWDSPNNIPVDEETFDMAVADALARARNEGSCLRLGSGHRC